MDPPRTDSARSEDTLTAYEFAMEEIRVASSKLGRALLARSLTRGHAVAPARECAHARFVYDKMIGLFTRARLDDVQRASLLKELALLRSRLEECEDADRRGTGSTSSP